MQLIKIVKITADLELISGMHVGGSESEIRIGGVDNQVIRNPHTGNPYIPGSSIKGRMRSLLEWRSGAVEEGPLAASSLGHQHVKPILALFGVGGSVEESDAKIIGPTRLSFWDLPLSQQWLDSVKERSLAKTEIKTENSINRITGTATNPRQTERVPAGAKFEFRLSMKVLDTDKESDMNLQHTLFCGLKMLELDSIGGSGSRGYGKIKLNNLMIDDESVQVEFDRTQPFDL